jgi:hypothetical protein
MYNYIQYSYDKLTMRLGTQLTYGSSPDVLVTVRSWVKRTRAPSWARSIAYVSFLCGAALKSVNYC